MEFPDLTGVSSQSAPCSQSLVELCIAYVFHHSILAIARQRWRWSVEWNIHDCRLELCILQTLAWHPAQSPSRHEVGGGASTGGRHALEEAGFLVLQCLLPW